MTGIPFMSLGLLFARYSRKLLQWKYVWPAAWLAASALHVVLFLLYGSDNMIGRRVSFLYPVQTIALFQIGMQFHAPAITSARSIKIREYSAVTYYLHKLVYMLLFGSLIHIYDGLTVPVGVKISVSLCICLLVWLILRWRRWKPLCWLFGLQPTKKTT